MGEEKDKKPHVKHDPPKKEDPKVEPAKTEAPAPEAGLDFAELDHAYETASNAQAALMERRTIGVQEVLGNLQEADSPDIADQLMLSLALGALGFASGYATAAVTAKLVSAEAVALTNAVQTALDDGLKDATVKVAGKLAEDTGASKPSFFASQVEGLVPLKQASLDGLSKRKLTAKDTVKAAAKDKQAGEMTKQIDGFDKFRAATNQSADRARQIQYEQSLSKWMNAMSQSELGQAKGGGTNLDEAREMSPTDHYKRSGAAGVIYVAFGQHPASRPFTVSGERSTIKVSGMTSAARDKIKNTPIKDLGMPIIATGYIYDGFLDGLSVSMGDNEITLSKNEAGTYSAYGHSDAMDGLKKAANKTSAAEAANVILEEDIGVATLEHATTK